MLKVSGIDAYYGEVQALHGVSMELGENEIVAIIGANGAGKSTLMHSIMGMIHPRRGTIEFLGASIASLRTNAIVRQGLVYIPEGREVFPNMTVLENLEMGAYARRYSAADMKRELETVYELFPRLQERKSQKAGSLSGGEQQMLAIARGMMSEPKLLMCDEPSLGLAPIVVDEMFNVIVRINKIKNIPIIIVEQNAFMAMTISDRTYVLENGVVAHVGKSADLISSPEIKRAYLGGK